MKWGDPAYLANCLKLLGQVLVSQNKTEEALAIYHEALDTLAQTENHLDKTRVLNELGSLHWKQKNLVEAERFLLKANSPFLQQSGNLFDQALVLNNLGTVYLTQGELDKAECSFQRSVVFWESCDDQVQFANALGGLAEVKAIQGNITEAQQLYANAIGFLSDYPQDVWGQKLQKRFSEAKRVLA